MIRFWFIWKGMQMRKIRTRENNSHSYWQSAADIMAGLLLILLLIIMLFMVRILYYSTYEGGNTEHENADDYEYEEEYTDKHQFDEEHEKDYDWQPDSNGGGGGNGEDGSEDNHEQTDYNEVTQEGLDEDTGLEPLYAAVYVVLVDGETKRAIEEPGARFELFDKNRAGLVLKTYYPDEADFRYFDTREDGTFFLPEKLKYGTYTIRNITPAAGYEPAEDVEFSFAEDHDWNNPFLVNVYAGPEKNEIYIQLVDSQGSPVHLASTIQIYAAEDIVTGDGTLRYAAGDLTDVIQCDTAGFGVSDELYLGKYRIRASFEEDFFAGTTDTVITAGSRHSKLSDVINEVVCEKTAIIIHLTDELYSSVPIKGAEYQIVNTATGEVRTSVTDVDGQIIFTDLSKNTTFEVKQIKPVSYFCVSDDVDSIYVDDKGLIGGNASSELIKTNRMIRVRFEMTDSVLRRPVSDSKVCLYDTDGNLVLSYISDEEEKLIEGLPYGRYRVEAEGTDINQWIEIEDTAQEQTIHLTSNDNQKPFVIILSAGVLLLVIIAGLFVAIRRRKKKNGE